MRASRPPYSRRCKRGRLCHCGRDEKSAAPFPLQFRKFVKIVSPASRENPNFGTEFPGWNGRAAVVECRACALSVMGKPELGRRSYDQGIWRFWCKACEARLATAVRAASAIPFYVQ